MRGLINSFINRYARKETNKENAEEKVDGRLAVPRGLSGGGGLVLGEAAGQLEENIVVQNKYLAYYISNCTSIKDTREFRGTFNTVVSYMKDSECENEVKCIFGDWIYTKLYILFRPSKEVKEIIHPHLVDAITLSTNKVMKSLYLYYQNIDECLKLATHFFNNRFDDEYFIIQTLNDATLLKYIQNTYSQDEIKEHFITWIYSTSDYVQQSNLLDLLLKYFPLEERVQNIYKKMQGGKSLYENAQNAHDDDIAATVKRCITQLAIWHNKHIPEEVTRDELPLTPYEFTANHIWFSDPKKMELLEAILTRLAIDQTRIQLENDSTVTAFEVLYMIANYIQKHPYKAEILEVLSNEMQDALELCITGYFARFINALQGFDDKFQLTIPFAKQLYSKISYDVSKGIEKLPEESPVILGTYSEEHRKFYIDFLLKTIDVKQLCKSYGTDSVVTNLPSVMNKFTGFEGWSIENMTLNYI